MKRIVFVLVFLIAFSKASGVQIPYLDQVENFILSVIDSILANPEVKKAIDTVKDLFNKLKKD